MPVSRRPAFILALRAVQGFFANPHTPFLKAGDGLLICSLLGFA